MIAMCFPPMAGVGTVRVTKYVKYLRQFNWNPTVVTMSEKNIKDYDTSLLKDIDSDVEIIKLNMQQKKNQKLEKTFYKELKKSINNIFKEKKYDAFFITGGPFEPLKIAPYIYKKFKIPYIIDLRDPWKLQKINKTNKIIEIKSRINKFLIGIKEIKIFKYAFSICTVNDTMTEQYKKEYPQLKDKFVTISNGYDKADYDNIITKTIEKFSIVYAGKFNVAAGFRDPTNLFKAIKIVNEKGFPVNFIHIGQEEEKVIEISQRENIEEYCDFLGKKTYEETLSYCKGANILVVISGNEKTEQTGKIFDYIGCQRPILVLSNGDSEIDVVCKNLKNSYSVKKNEIDNIVNIIIKIYNDKNDQVENEIIEKYDRRFLTYQLVQILEKMKKGK